jgi:hypothetical protein
MSASARRKFAVGSKGTVGEVEGEAELLGLSRSLIRHKTP